MGERRGAGPVGRMGAGPPGGRGGWGAGLMGRMGSRTPGGEGRKPRARGCGEREGRTPLGAPRAPAWPVVVCTSINRRIQACADKQSGVSVGRDTFKHGQGPREAFPPRPPLPVLQGDGPQLCQAGGACAALLTRGPELRTFWCRPRREGWEQKALDWHEVWDENGPSHSQPGTLGGLGGQALGTHQP